MAGREKPADFVLEEAYIWTAKHLVQAVEQHFGLHYKSMGNYKLLYRMGYSYQQAHRDYDNASREQQHVYVEGNKKNH